MVCQEEILHPLYELIGKSIGDVCRNQKNRKKEGEMKVNFLSTNGWFDTDCGNAICTLIETKTAYIILDASLYTTMAKREKAERHVRRIFPETFSAYDGLSIDI